MRLSHREEPLREVARAVHLEAGLELPGPHRHLTLGRRLGASAYAQTFVVRSVHLTAPVAVVEFFPEGPAVPRGGATLGAGRCVLDLRPWPEWPAVAVVSQLPLTLPAPYDRLSLQRPVGWGGQGEIWLGSSRDLPRLQLAVKLFSHLWYAPDTLARQNCLDEARHGLLVNSAHIVRTYQALSLEGQPHWPPVATVMQYYPYSLACVLHDLQTTEQKLPASVALTWVRQLLAGLRDLHDGHGLVHRDLKPGNILLRLPGAGDYTGPDSLADSAALIADLGAACPVGERPVYQLRQDGWKAPELYRGDDPDRERVAAPAEDLFALGLLLRDLGDVVDEAPTWLYQATYALVGAASQRPSAAAVLEWLESVETISRKDQILASLARTQADLAPQPDVPLEPLRDDADEPPPSLCYRPSFGPLR